MKILRKATEELDQMKAEDGWPDLLPEHVLAKYAREHMSLYGVEPSDIDEKNWDRAIDAVETTWALLGDEPIEMMQFVGWAWIREKESAAHKKGARRRLGWPLLFSSALVTDYNVTLQRLGKQPPTPVEREEDKEGDGDDEPVDDGNATLELDDWKLKLRARMVGRGSRAERMPYATLENVIVILKHDERWAGVLAYDEFRHEIIVTRPPPWREDDKPAAAQHVAGPWRDSDVTRLRAWLANKYGHKQAAFNVSAGMAANAIAVAADANPLHRLRDWLGALPWDGKARVDRWLSNYLGVEPTEYTANVGRWFLIGAVARVHRPGCKLDTMIVLEGPQGAKKSTALRRLFGDDYFVDTPIDFDSKDRFLQVRGAWCCEVAELDGFDRHDVNRIKSYLSSQKDTFRPPYGKSIVTIDRQCVFAGTCNGDTYLRDETGNRRFFPLRCGAIDLDTLAHDREQLWAEAVHLYRAGARWWPEADEAAACADEQNARVQRDAWTDSIGEWLELRHSVGDHRDPQLPSKKAKPVEVSIGDILEGCFAMKPDKWTQTDQNRVAKALRLLGYDRRQARVGDSRVWVYRRRVTSVTSWEDQSGDKKMFNDFANVTSVTSVTSRSRGREDGRSELIGLNRVW